VALEAIDSDVIKTYVRLGLGVGIAAEMAVQDVLDDCAHHGGKSGLVARPAGHLFGHQRGAGRVQARRLPAQLRATPLPSC